MIGLRHQAIAVGVILAVATTAALVTLTMRGAPVVGGADEPGDRVLRAAAELREDRVHVAPDGRGMLDEQAERELERLIAERDLPVYVVVWESSWFAGYRFRHGAVRQILEQLDEPAALALWQGSEDSAFGYTDGYIFRDARAEGFERLAEPEFLGEASLRLPAWVASLPEGLELAELGSNRDPDVGGQILVGVLLGGVALVGSWLLIGLLRMATGRRFRNLPYET